MGIIDNLRLALGKPQEVSDATSGLTKKPEERTFDDNLYIAKMQNSGFYVDPDEWQKKR